MNILTCTTTAAVRAVIGVSEASQEIPDQYLVDRRIEGALRVELSSWLPASLEVLQDAADAADEGDPAILTWDAVQQAATYWCAWEVVKTAPIALFQSMEDGQNKVTRPVMKHQDLLDLLYSSYLAYRGRALEDTTPPIAPATFSFAGRSVPSYDPVSG